MNAEIDETPLSLDVLADLHAGVFDDEETAALTKRVQDDPVAQRILEALDRVQHDLRTWLDAPAPEPPAAVIDDVLTALQNQSSGPTRTSPRVVPHNQVTGPSLLQHRHRPARARAQRWNAVYAAAGLGAAACAAFAITLVLNRSAAPSESTAALDTPALSEFVSPPSAAPGSAADPADALPAIPLSGTEIHALVGQRPVLGELEDPARRAACLTGLGLADSTPVLGAQTVDIGGPAVLMVLPDGHPGQLRAVAVRPGCSSTDAQRVAETHLGGHAGR